MIMECKDCKEFNICEKVSEEICDDFKADIKDEELDNITNIAPEENEETETAETSEASEEDKELNKSAEKAKDSIDKLIDAITEAVKKSSNTPKAPKTEPKKKPFKIGFWGYLTIAAVVKGVIEVSRAVADTKRPKR